MKLPKMIIFDYGHTLGYEPGFDKTRGNQAVFERIKVNRYGKTAEDIQNFANELTNEIKLHTNSVVEVHAHIFDRILYEYLGIELDVSLNEIETIFWDNAAPGSIMPDADKLITYVNSRKIRSGVISNITFSGHTLANRLNRLLPDNQFEFIMASSEYVFRKPHRVIFETAIRKSGLKPDEIWYCGDNTRADIIGASNVGIFPVWYESRLECSYRDKSLDIAPDCTYLHIHEWSELIEILESATEE